MSSWTSVVKETFRRHSGLAPPPKLLRAIFIVWLRDEAHHNAATPDVLKSCAKLMKHQLATQESDGACGTLARLDRTPSFHLVYSSIPYTSYTLINYLVHNDALYTYISR